MTSIATTEPWGPVADYWSYGLQQARNLYDQPYPVYGGPRTAGYGPTMQRAMTGIEQRAAAGSPWLRRAQDTAGGMMTPQQNPMTPWLAPFQSNAPTPMTQQFQNWSRGTGAPGFADMRSSGTMVNPATAGAGRIASGAAPGYSDIYAGGRAGNPAMQHLASGARGDYLDSNPWLDQTVGRTLSDVEDRVNARFTSSGRYGSRAHAGALADSLGDTSARMRQAAYESERGRQLQAQQALGTLGESAAQRRMAAGSEALGRMAQGTQLQGQLGESAADRLYRAGAGTLDAQMRGGQLARGAYEQDAANRLTGASLTGQGYASDQDRALSASRLSPWLAQQDYFDLDKMAELGQFKMGHNQQVLNDQRQAWQEENFAPYDQLTRYFGYGGGVGGGAGQTTTENPTYGNPWLTGLGAAGAGVGILRGLNDIGVFNKDFWDFL